MLFVLVPLAFSVLAVAGVVGLMFVDVALRGAEPAGLSSAGTARWRSPLVLGKELTDWASRIAESSATRKLQSGRESTAAHELVGDLHVGVSAAIEQAWQRDDSQAVEGCPSFFQSMIAVTPPEAIRAADYVKRLHPDEVETVREQAVQNLKRTAGMNHDQYRAASVRCPLMGADNACMAYAVRPLRCRGGCDLSQELNRGCGTDGATVLPRGVDDGEFEPRGRLVTQGAERGFSRALQAAGLDGELYDLNGALVAAIDTANAAERWVHGERIFDGCRLYQ